MRPTTIFTLSNARQFYLSSGERCHSMGSIALHPTLYVTLSNTNNFTCQQERTGAQWVNIYIMSNYSTVNFPVIGAWYM
jgi:hypothetical protein